MCVCLSGPSDTAAMLSAHNTAVLSCFTGHEGDARVLQQQLSSLMSSQQEAQQYVKDNPPPAVPQHEQPQAKPATAPQRADVDWKWDILRPVNLTSPAK